MIFQNTKTNIRIYLIIAIGVYIKLNSLNTEDLWWDEMLSFWVSNPEITFEQTINRNLEVNLGSQLIFSILLKSFFYLFNYDPNTARYFSVLFGILNIPLLIILVKKINYNESIEIILFLFLFNSYLISYDQELRSYSLVVSISLLSFIYFFNFLKKKKKRFLFIISLINLVGLLNHTFYGIIIFSQFLFLLINNNKEIFKFSLFQILIFIIFVLISKETLIAQITFSKMWFPEIGPEFLFDLYFPRFFSSKTLGLVYLLFFLIITTYNKELIFKKNSSHFFFIVIIFFSYFLPFLYQMIKEPILTDRYIIFIVIPLILLISNGLVSFRYKNIKIILITIILLSTLTDTALRIFKNETNKPEIKKSLSYISAKKLNEVLIDDNKDFKVLKNYINKLNPDIIVKKNLQGHEKQIWKICYLPITNFKCELNDTNKIRAAIQEKIEFNLVTIVLFDLN